MLSAIRQAEAYDTRCHRLGADADFYSREKNAQAILVRVQTEGEAQSIKPTKARRLQSRQAGLRSSASSNSAGSFIIESTTERLSYQDEAAVTKQTRHSTLQNRRAMQFMGHFPH